MENNNITATTNKDKWKIPAIIFMASSVILAGTSIFLFIQNDDKQSRIDSAIVSKCDDSNDSGKDTQTNTNVPNNSEISESNQNSNEGYLVISEWNIKIKMQDVANVTYKYTSSAPEWFKGLVQYDSKITLVINDQALTDVTCGLGVDILRIISVDNAALQGSGWESRIRAVGNYSYLKNGPDQIYCGNSDDGELIKRLAEQFVLENIEAL